MSALYWAGAVAVILLMLWNWLAPSVDKVVRQSVKSGDLSAVLALIAKKKPAVQPTAFNQAIRLLWDLYERRLALELIKELAARHGGTRIAQYWLKQALTVEPQIAHGVLSRAFVTEHYRPEVAAQCGPVG